MTIRHFHHMFLYSVQYRLVILSTSQLEKMWIKTTQIETKFEEEQFLKKFLINAIVGYKLGRVGLLDGVAFFINKLG
jgi:hypothetical protein